MSRLPYLHAPNLSNPKNTYSQFQSGKSQTLKKALEIVKNPAFVRQIMMKLKKAGLMSSINGHAKPSLAKPAEEITLLDIYKAVEGNKPLLHLDTHTNPECGVGINIQLALQEYYNEIQRGTETHMSGISLQDIIGLYRKKAGQTDC